MTKSERQAAAIAKKLIKALMAIEQFQEDPEMIFDDATVQMAGIT